MKKERNTFFGESSFMNQTVYPQTGLNIANQPFQATSYSNQGFYAGAPLQQGNYTTQMPSNTNANMTNYDYSEIDARISKIERQISRLDARVSKLENSTFYTEETNNNNIYMV